MKALGIDYGRAKVGIAVAEYNTEFLGLAEPKEVIRVKDYEDALRKVILQAEIEHPEIIVVGISENEMSKEQEKFVQQLSNMVSSPVVTFDETLSTQDAQYLAISSGIPQQKRHKMEDAFAATIVLQSWLDSKRQEVSDKI